jgi:hypothetical protein
MQDDFNAKTRRRKGARTGSEPSSPANARRRATRAGMDKILFAALSVRIIPSWEDFLRRISRISRMGNLSILFCTSPVRGVIFVEPRTRMCPSSVRSGIFSPKRDPHSEALGAGYVAPTGLEKLWRMGSTKRSLLAELRALCFIGVIHEISGSISSVAHGRVASLHLRAFALKSTELMEWIGPRSARQNKPFKSDKIPCQLN